MSKQMKFIIFFILIAFSEVSSLKLKTESNTAAYNMLARKHHRSSKSRALVFLPESNLIEKVKAKFNSWGTNLENSKIFNFLLGALLKTFSLLEGNDILAIIKCVVSSVEVFYNAIKFPAKNLKELQAEQKIEDAKMEAALKAAEAGENADDAGLANEMKTSEKEAREVNCHGENEIMKEANGLDYIDDIETTEEEARFSQSSSKVRKFNPKKWLKKITSSSFSVK